MKNRVTCGLTAGVAIVGASVIAITPIAVPPIAASLSMRAINTDVTLTAAAETNPYDYFTYIDMTDADVQAEFSSRFSEQIVQLPWIPIVLGLAAVSGDNAAARPE